MVKTALCKTRWTLPIHLGKFKSRRIVSFLLLSFGCFAFFSSKSGRMEDWYTADASTQSSVFSSIDTNVTRSEDYWIHVAKGPDCAKARPQKRGTLPLVNLLSIHGSGNTWLRWMIERATGLCTGSLYGDTELRVAGLSCEDYVTPYLFKHTIAVRSHYFHQMNASKILFLVRNPYDAIISDYNRIKSYNNHTGTAEVSQFYTKDWQSFAEKRATEWIREIEATLSSASTEVFVVFYENIRQDPQTVLRESAVFLRVLVPPTRLQCALKSQTGRAKRQRRDLPSDIWTSHLRKLIDGSICQAFNIFTHRKLQNLPEYYTSCRQQFVG